MKALVLYEDLKGSSGVPLYIDRSDRVRFEVGSYTSRSKAALDREEERQAASKSKNYGKVLYPIPVTLDGGPLPTLDDFLEEQRIKSEMKVGNIRLGGQFSNENWSEDEFSNENWVPEGQ